MARKERLPQAKNVPLPIYAPTEDGKLSIEVASATLRGGTMVVEFRNTLPGVAIQRMIERGSILGLQFVMISPDEKNEAAQQKLAEENAQSEALETIDEPSEDPPKEDDNG